MRIEQIHLTRWRGADVVLNWHPVVVLFGANDAGKSNLLEAITAVIEADIEPERRQDPLQPGWPPPATRLWFRLEHEVASAPDAHFFASLVQHGTWVPRPGGTHRGGYVELPDGYTFEVASEDGSTLDAATVVEQFRDEALVWAADQTDDWDAVASAYERVLDEGLRSTLFEFVDEEVSWIFPARGEVNQEGRDALEGLGRLRHHFEDEQVPIFDLVCGDDDGGPLQMFTWQYEPEEPLPIRVVDLSDASAYQDAIGRVESYVRREAQRLEAQRRGGGFAIWEGGSSLRDPWLAKAEDGTGYDLSPHVEQVCAELSARLTREAPTFVSEVSEIIVEPLPIPAWRAAGARVRITLRRRDEDVAYPLPSAGRGVARYVLLTIELVVEPELTRKEMIEGPEVRSHTLYILDEPEQHLHPLAQADAAEWLSARARAGAEVCIATHSPAFLDMPFGDVGYYGVQRLAGRTTAQPVGADIVAALRDRSAEFGMSPGEMLLLTRAVLIVEGKHDEMVLQHCYGHQLREHRIVVVPIRGTDNAAGIPETEFLARVNRRLIVLFDGTLQAKLDAARSAGKPIDRMTKEERAAIELVRGIEDRSDTPVHVVAFDVPDILAAFPEETMRAAVSALGGKFSAWQEIHDGYRRAPAENFKTYLLREAGIPSVSATRLLAAILQLTEPGHPVAGPLHHAVQEVIKLSKRRGRRQTAKLPPETA